MSSNICDFEDMCGTRGRPPLNSKNEEIMVQSFFQPFGQSSRDDQSRHSQRGDLEGSPSVRGGAHYPDNQELLDYDYPAVPERVTVMTRDAADTEPRPMSRKASSRFKPSPPRARSAPQSHKQFDVPVNIQYATKNRSHAMHNASPNHQSPQHYHDHQGRHEEESTLFEDLKSANTILDEADQLRSPPRVRNHATKRTQRSSQQRMEYNDDEDSTMLGGLKFVSESGHVKPLFPITEASQQSQQSMYSYSVDSASQRSGSPTPPIEDLPLDEYNVTLADDYSKTSSPSRFGNVKHQLPSQRRAANFAMLEQRRSRCLKGFGILTLILAISMGVVAYVQFVDGQQNVTRMNTGSGTDPSQAGKADGGPKDQPPTNPTNPDLSPEEVEILKASEAYSILGPQVENPALLLDPETAQGKAFNQIYQETKNSGDDGERFLKDLAELEVMEAGRVLQTFREYRITQRFALMVLYFATGGEFTWFYNLGWDIFENNECEWHGVECFNRNRITTSLNLCKF